MEQAAQIVKELYEEKGEALERLRAKCNWEQRTGVSIVMDYGDPRNWK